MEKHEPFVPLSTRVSPKTLERLEILSKATGRTKSFLTSQAIELYVNTQEQQVKFLKKMLKKTDSKNANFIDHKKLSEWLSNWNTKK